MIDTESIDERYAQFERRGQPDRHPTLEFGSVALERFIHDMMGEIKRLRALQPNREPEQNMGSLSALQKLTAAAWGGGGMEIEEVTPLHDEVCRALTANGVPDEVRLLPEKWRSRSGLISAGYAAEFANDLERAIAAASAEGDE